jgi:hypothetical protein
VVKASLGACVLLVLAAAALAAPPARAQVPLAPATLQVTLVDPGLPIVESRPTSLALLVRYETGPGSFAPQGPTEIFLTVAEKPEWLNAVPFPLKLNVDLPPTSPVNGSSTVAKASLNVTLRPGALGFEKGEVAVKAVARPNGNIQGAEAVSPKVKLSVAYLGKAAIEFQGFPLPADGTIPGPLVLKGGREQEVPLVVTNQGNAPSRMTFTVASHPQNSLAEPPAPVTLAPGEKRIVYAKVRLPWTEAEEGLFEVEVLPEANGEKGASLKASVMVEGKSAAAPGFEAPLLALGLAAGVLLARRRRSAL